MEGHEVATGLFLVLVASGCMQMTGESTESSSFEDLGLSVEEVEAVTGTEYKASESGSASESFNFSSTVRTVESFFTKDENLSEAPDSVRSMVVALNGSEEEGEPRIRFNETVTIEGYQAQRLDSGNETVLYGEEDNLSFFVRAEGDEGIYSSTRELYLKIAEQVEEFRNSSN